MPPGDSHTQEAKVVRVDPNVVMTSYSVRMPSNNRYNRRSSAMVNLVNRDARFDCGATPPHHGPLQGGAFC